MIDPHAFCYECPECGPRTAILPGSYGAQTLACQACHARAPIESRHGVTPSHFINEHGVLTRPWAHTPAPWHVAKSARSVNLPGGGKVRMEAAPELDVGAHMRLIAMAPSLLNLLERVALGCGEEFAAEVGGFLDYIERGPEALEPREVSSEPRINEDGQVSLGV